MLFQQVKNLPFSENSTFSLDLMNFFLITKVHREKERLLLEKNCYLLLKFIKCPTTPKNDKIVYAGILNY